MSTKNEKKLIDEKVAKVREVVQNVSKNDIVLALHNFDMDVERTINAFCHGGAESALGDWEQTGAAAKKKQQKKKKQGATQSVSNVSVSSTNIPVKQNGDTASSASSVSLANGFTNGYAVPTQTVPKPAPVAVHAVSDNKTSSKNVAKDGAKSQQLPPKNVPAKSTNADSEFSRHEPKRNISTGVLSSPVDVVQCFQKLRRALADRERQVLTHFESGGSDRRFTCDPSKLLQSILHFGELETPKQEAAVSPQAPRQDATTVSINHSTSHSSLVSSVGEDSGLGQTSPIAKVEKSTAKVVGNGGIVMQSDGLSESDLADLQRRIEETLKAQGIDPSVLANISSTAPRRRPPKQKPSGKDGKSGGGAGASRDKARNLPQVELSILQ